MVLLQLQQNTVDGKYFFDNRLRYLIRLLRGSRLHCFERGRGIRLDRFEVGVVCRFLLEILVYPVVKSGNVLCEFFAADKRFQVAAALSQKLLVVSFHSPQTFEKGKMFELFFACLRKTHDFHRILSRLAHKYGAAHSAPYSQVPHQNKRGVNYQRREKQPENYPLRDLVCLFLKHDDND